MARDTQCKDKKKAKCGKCRKEQDCPIRDMPLGGMRYTDTPGLFEQAEAEDLRFSGLLEAERDYLWRHAVGLMRNPTQADDLVQETMLRAYTARDTFEQGTNFRAWLTCIQKNTFINIRKKEERNPAYGFMPVDDVRMLDALGILDDAPNYNPEHVFFNKHIDQKLRTAVSELPDRLRAPFIMRNFEDRSYREVARTLGIPIGTMKSRVFRACEQLRAQLEA
jgi:RNA polymerase sigma-70 factor, ECF subfamily